MGAAQGLAHIGVIKVLSDRGMKFNVITGSSMGALIGACYAKDGNIRNLENTIVNLDMKKLFSFFDLNISMLSKGLISGEKVTEYLSSLIGNIEFKDLKIPLGVIAADISTGEEILLNQGSVVEAVRASISIPGIFMPVKINNRYLIDGGSVNPLPVDAAKKMGANYIVVSNIVPSPINRETTAQNNKTCETQNESESIIKKVFSKYFKKTVAKNNDTPNIINTLLQALHIMEYKIISERLKDADLVITSDAQGIGTLDFSKVKEAIKIGEEAAEKILAANK